MRSAEKGPPQGNTASSVGVVVRISLTVKPCASWPSVAGKSTSNAPGRVPEGPSTPPVNTKPSRRLESSPCVHKAGS